MRQKLRFNLLLQYKNTWIHTLNQTDPYWTPIHYSVPSCASQVTAQVCHIKCVWVQLLVVIALVSTFRCRCHYNHYHFCSLRESSIFQQRFREGERACARERISTKQTIIPRYFNYPSLARISIPLPFPQQNQGLSHTSPLAVIKACLVFSNKSNSLLC